MIKNVFHGSKKDDHYGDRAIVVAEMVDLMRKSGSMTGLLALYRRLVATVRAIG